jgi:hypothetical protein
MLYEDGLLYHILVMRTLLRNELLVLFWLVLRDEMNYRVDVDEMEGLVGVVQVLI